MNAPFTAELATLPLRSFVHRFGKELPKLINMLHEASEIREHPTWGSVVPYNIVKYGEGRSLGHCVRPDIILTTDGPKICEMDFVASGRAHLLDSLRDFPEARAQVLGTFAEWYHSMGPKEIRYGTGTGTSCFEETVLFADALRYECGVNIRAVNLDTVEPESHVLVDRLAYWSEMTHSISEHRRLAGYQVTTAEPYLDSKAIFPLIHDRTMDDVLIKYLSMKGLEFWRQAMPLSFLLEDVNEQAKQLVGVTTKHWAVKSTDVETDTCWGSRGTILGSKYRPRDFRALIERNKRMGKKDIGTHPILQRLHESEDFAELWNLAVEIGTGAVDPDHFSREVAPETRLPAQGKVFGRIGVFVPIVHGKALLGAAEYAEVVLRHDQLVHGASDAIAMAVRLT